MENEMRAYPEMESSERKERKEFLVKKFEEGLDDPNIIGYHGTSIQTVKYIEEFGGLPGSENSRLSTSTEGVPELSIFYLNSEHKDKVKFRIMKQYHKNDELLAAASSYASTIAERHYFYEQLGIPLDSQIWPGDLMYSYSSNDYEELDEIAKKYHITREYIIQALKNTKKADPQGVVLGILPSALENHEWLETTEGGELAEIVVKIPEGFSYKFIGGIEPQGQTEYEYFTKLQSQIESGKH